MIAEYYLLFEVISRQIARKTTGGPPPLIRIAPAPPSKPNLSRNLKPPGVGSANSLLEYEGKMLVRLTRTVFRVHVKRV